MPKHSKKITKAKTVVVESISLAALVLAGLALLMIELQGLIKIWKLIAQQ